MTMRLDLDLLVEIKKLLKKIKPRETLTQFIETATWRRVKKEQTEKEYD
jgi:hypothetical protein